MNRAERRRAERDKTERLRMTIPDLGAIKAQNEAKAKVPRWNVEKPIFSLPSALPLSQENGPSFTQAIERAAINLGIDGWKIEDVREVALVNIGDSEQGPVAVFQIVVQVSPVIFQETDEDVADSVASTEDL